MNWKCALGATLATFALVAAAVGFVVVTNLLPNWVGVVIASTGVAGLLLLFWLAFYTACVEKKTKAKEAS